MVSNKHYTDIRQVLLSEAGEFFETNHREYWQGIEQYSCNPDFNIATELQAIRTDHKIRTGTFGYNCVYDEV